MIKYPLYVTLDTNIFDANKLDFSQDSTLGLLVNHYWGLTVRPAKGI